MPKKYEDEIRDILRSMDGFPGEAREPRAPRPRPRASFPGIAGLRRLDAHRLMGGALIMMLFAWILQGPWSAGFPALYRMAGYISIASIVLFIVALVLAFRGGGSFGSPMRHETRWRGQVINMPRRGGLWWSWRRNIERFFSRFGRNRHRGPMGRRGRDSFQW